VSIHARASYVNLYGSIKPFKDKVYMGGRTDILGGLEVEACLQNL
jgi:hypothetical protein